MIRTLLPLLLLAACAPSGPPNPEQVCERQALEAPPVKELIMRGAGQSQFRIDHADELRAAKQDATVACLKSRGAIRAGGVERQRPLH